VLDLPAQLELPSDPFLLDDHVLMRSTSSAIWLKARASLPISSLDPTCTRAL